MIYVLAGTQVITVIAFCFIFSWILDAAGGGNRLLAQQKQISEERLERVMESHTEQLKAVFEMMSERAFTEREQLLNRIQAPEMAVAATPAAQPGDVGVEDDEETISLEAPPVVGERIPYDDLLVRPKQPVGAMPPFGDLDEEATVEPTYEEDDDDGVS